MPFHRGGGYFFHCILEFRTDKDTATHPSAANGCMEWQKDASSHNIVREWKLFTQNTIKVTQAEYYSL